MFIEKTILLPAGSRCCPVHLADGVFTDDAFAKFDDIEVRNKSDFNRTGILDLIHRLQNTARSNNERRINFDGNDLNDDDYLNLVGLNKSQFDDLCSHVKAGTIRDTKVRSTRTCVGIMLTKLKSGMSNRILSTVFNIGKDGIQRAVRSGRMA